MTFDEWLSSATEHLTDAGINTARLDAIVLLEDTLSSTRAKILAHPGKKLSAREIETLANLLKRREQHIPLAYIRQKAEFYGREFVLSPAVLQPRPESETMIEVLKKLVADTQANQAKSTKPKLSQPIRVLDVGTGSGAIGITVALELPNLHVELLDIDRSALKVAKTNVDKFTLNISVMHGDLLVGLDRSYDFLLCNLPYVPDDFKINLAAAHEPKLAIFGGPDGLDLYRRLFSQADKLADKPLYILTESLPPQHSTLEQIAKEFNYCLVESSDFINVFKLA